MEKEVNYIQKTSGLKKIDYFGYAMGDVASLLVFGLVNSILQIYYTDYLGLSLVSVMILFTVSRIWDACNDPLMGRIIDTTKCKPGSRYRRWLVLLSVPLAIATVLMFVDVRSLGQTGAFIFATITYILFCTLYTGTNIPYGSMAAVITSDEKERNTLSVFRSMGSTFGAFPAMALAGMWIVSNPDGTKTFKYNVLLIGVIIIAVLSIVGYFICYKFSKERIVTVPEKKKVKGYTFKTIKGLLSTKSFLVVSLAGMLFLAGQMYQQSYNQYLFTYVFDAPGLMSLPTIMQYLPVAIVMFFSNKLCKKFGRKEICAVGMLLAGLSFLSIAFLKVTNPYIYLGVCLVSGIGNSFIFLMVWALVNDAIDDYMVKSGRRDDGTAYSLFTFCRQIGQTVAAILVNAGLMSFNYDKDLIGNSPEMLESMYLQSCLIPAILFILIFVLLWFFYPLNKKRLQELQVEKEAVLEKIALENEENKEQEVVSE
ncbi:MAG: MFS transporter [Erysipelotrichaceae bacterium]|nr:MFS transporter [Erysipelotrichaceae bacterium]